MIMAAGLGSRMRPLTDIRPKPMVMVAGKALIDHTLDWVADAGVSQAVVNVHYHADMLEAHLNARQHPVIIISDERKELLETGGGMVKAQGALPDPFFCLNSDNILRARTSNPFRDLSERWNGEQMDALLLLIEQANVRDYAGKGDFHLTDDGLVSRREEVQIAPFVYTGVQLVSHRLLRDAPKGKFSTNILWDRAIAEGRLHGIRFHGELFEVGSPEAIAPTEAALRDD